MTVQTISGNVAPPFCYCWTHFWSTLWSLNYAYHISFQRLGSQESSTSNGMWFGGEMKKLWPFEDEHAKLSGNFAAETPFGRVFRSCEPPFGTRVPLHSTSTPISQLWNGLRKSPFSVKFPFCCEMISKLQNGWEITSKLRNGLQIAKLTCEMEEGLQKHLAKPREVAKMPTEPRDHASEEESPAHLEITHTKPLTPFLTS